MIWRSRERVEMKAARRETPIERMSIGMASMTEQSRVKTCGTGLRYTTQVRDGGRGGLILHSERVQTRVLECEFPS